MHQAATTGMFCTKPITLAFAKLSFPKKCATIMHQAATHGVLTIATSDFWWPEKFNTS